MFFFLFWGWNGSGPHIPVTALSTCIQRSSKVLPPSFCELMNSLNLKKGKMSHFMQDRHFLTGNSQLLDSKHARLWQLIARH